jgi:hypothetical protein
VRNYFVIGFCCSLRFVRGVRGSCCCSCLKWEPIFVIGFCCSLSFVRGVRGPFSGACLKRKPILSSVSVVLWGLSEVLEDRVVVLVLSEDLFCHRLLLFFWVLSEVLGDHCVCSCLKWGPILSSASVVLWVLSEVLEDRVVVPVLNENLFCLRLLLFFEVCQRC